jgi:hypothetical protein
MTIDLLKEMPQITAEIGINAVDLSEHAAIDATFYDRSPALKRVSRWIIRGD